VYTLSDFNFELPSDLIAQEPTEKRDESKLLLSSGKNQNNIIAFHQIVDHLQKNDVLVFNDSRVINAQLTLNKDGKRINVNLNKPISANIWLGFAKPAKKLKIGDEFIFGDNKLCVKNKQESGDIEFEFILNNTSIFDFLDIYGQVPLPQYIKRCDNSYADDLERYQTVYSKKRGSVAAATAGLHFTKELIERIRQKGVETVFVTLHVGAGTFLPVKTENISEHKMHSEWCEVSQEAADKINKAKKNGNRVIVIGTTAMRTIESCSENDILFPKIMDTNIFITPGYRFQIADMLLTNFHLPKSTLFMLVCAFAGYKEMHSLYQFAIDNKMRFFSYGDAMLINKNCYEWKGKK
jgi:S-adenosylmethionine:tRNA ribosyltransferase-isomerase